MENSDVIVKWKSKRKILTEKFEINLQNEREYWKNYILKYFTHMP